MQLPAARGKELAGMLYGLGRLRLQPPVQWMRQAVAVLALHATSMGIQVLDMAILQTWLQ